MSDSTPISSATANIRSDDPAWAYGYVDPSNNKHVICCFCKKVIKGGRITRLKEHLGGVKGDIAPCKNVPGDVKWQMERLILEGKKDRAKKRQLNEEIGNPYGTPGGDADEDDVEVEEVEPFTNPITPTTTSRKGKEKVSQISTQNKRRGVSNTSQPPMSNFFAPRTSPGSQPGIKSAMATKELKDATDLAVGRFWFDANLPFNAARSKFFQPMADGIAAVGPGYKMPSYHDLRGKILGKIVLEVNAFMEHYKSCWSETGCSVMADGWTDERQRTLINFLVYCPKGVMFLKSVDTSPIIKNSDALFKIFDEIVLLVGPNNIVQFITDNDATYKAAGKRVAEKYGTFYWTACAAHCIDLMLEDMAKPHLFPVNASTIETARKITKFIYNHLSVLNLMRREYTNGRELIRPAITRFATNFISLQCLFKYRKELRQMFTSTAWVESNASSTPVGIEITEIILNNTFWKDVEHILKVSEALVVVLRLADSEEKPAMGYVYEAMDRAKEVIQKRLKKKKDYQLYWKIIDRRWENQLHSALHAAAYYLNPAFFFSPTFSKHSEVMRGLNNVIEKLVPDFDTQDMIFKQCDAYKDSLFDFGSAAAIRNREKMSPDKWWDRFGNGTPELKKLAIRILSQCISASGCERNWSIFEHIHSPKRNRLEHQRLNDLVFVHYNLKLRERKNMEIPILKSSARIASKLNYLCPQFFPGPDLWSHEHLNHISESSAASSQGSSLMLCDSIPAENLLKFHLRPYAQLGLDRSGVPNLVTRIEIVNELLAEIPEIEDASKHISQFWYSSGKAIGMASHMQDNIIMIEEPWINGNACISNTNLANEATDASEETSTSNDSSATDFKHEPKLPSCLENISREDMEIVLLGTGSSQPSKYRNVSSIYINLFSKGSLLLDCGEGTLAQLKRRFGVKGADDAVRGLRCVWISHMHADHHTGLARVLSWRCELLRSIPHEPLLVIGPRPLKRFLDAYSRLEDLDMQFLDCRHTTESTMDALAGSLDSNGDCLPSTSNVNDGTVNRIGGRVEGQGLFSSQKNEATLFAKGSQMQSYWKRPGSPVESAVDLLALKKLKRVLLEAGLEAMVSVPVVHCPQAFGVVLQAAERINNVGKTIPGWKLVYSGDTRPCQALVDASHGATVLIHEATFEDGMMEEAVARNHSVTKEAIEVGASAGVYRIILTHFSQRYPKIPIFDATHMDKTCIAFDMMSINVADLPILPKVVPHLTLLFRNEMAVDESDDIPVSVQNP